MDEKRKAWHKKYKVDFNELIMPEHVEHYLPSEHYREGYFVGFDGRRKKWEQLTEEEREDYEKQIEDVPKKLQEYLNKHKNRRVSEER